MGNIFVTGKCALKILKNEVASLRNKLLYILSLSILISGFSSAINMRTNLTELKTIEVQAQTASENLRIIDSRTILNSGNMGYIIIQGTPRRRYTLKSSFKIDNTVIDITQWRITGDNGQATFNWVVSPESVPGTYNILIYGGDGERLHLSHTVLN